MLKGMKVNREMVSRAGLVLLNEVGLEQLTLRRLGTELKVQAAAIYWHFKSKQELIDEMATLLLAEGAPGFVPTRAGGDWTVWAVAFGNGLRKTLLGYRDGARMVSGTMLKDTVYMKTAERIAGRLVEEGFTVRQAVVLMSTIYSFTLSFVMEEQAVYPRPGEREPGYDLAERGARLDAAEFPLMRQAGGILLDKFDRRFKEGLDLIVRGAGAE